MTCRLCLILLCVTQLFPVPVHANDPPVRITSFDAQLHSENADVVDGLSADGRKRLENSLINEVITPVEIRDPEKPWFNFSRKTFKNDEGNPYRHSYAIQLKYATPKRF